MHPLPNAVLATLMGLSAPLAGTYDFSVGPDGTPVFTAALTSGPEKLETEPFDLYCSFDVWAKSVTIDGRRYKRRSMPFPDAENADISCYKPPAKASRDSFCTFRFRASEGVTIDVDGRILIAHTSGPVAYAIFRKLYASGNVFDWFSKDGRMRWHSTPDTFDFYAADSR
jgi:hypothetical protein